MCKLLIAEKQLGKNDELLRFIQAQDSDFKQEKDGFGAFILNKDDEVLTIKRMYTYDDVMDFVEKNFESARLIGLHSRTGTSGDKDVKNIHFFDIDGAYMAHNGMVSKYGYSARSKSSKKSWEKDSSDGFRYSTGYYDESHVWHSYADEKEAIEGQPRLALADAKEDFPNEEDLLYADMADIVEETMTCRGCNSSDLKTCKRHRKAFQKRARERGYVVDDKSGRVTAKIILSGEKAGVKNMYGVETKYELKDGQTVFDEYCDTWHFLKYLPRPINRESIARQMKDSDFYGMGFIWDDKEKKAYIFAEKKDCKVIHRTKSGKNYTPYTAITSYDPTMEIELVNHESVRGLLVEKDKEDSKIDIEPLPLVDGVYELAVS